MATAHALLRAAVPLMLEDGGGSAVNISSAMGRLAGRGYVAYGTAKGALTHYTRLAAADLAPKIRVNAIAVGSVATSALDVVLQTEALKSAMESGTPSDASASPRTSPPPSSTSARRPGGTSPARSSKSTVGSRPPTSTSACPI